ncbi:MAG: DUF2071 domain-containing protein [Planctomycetota bacterium]
MKIPLMRGVIDRRILANFRIAPEVLARALPAPFRPKTVAGHGIGGICMIRLKELRPRAFPAFLGLTSENAAHRFAVEWDTDEGVREGVYIPRRDSSSRLSALLGGRLFAGVHHLARFDVREEGEAYSVALTSNDGETRVLVEGEVADSLPDGTAFGSLEEASGFFERGSLGYSATVREGVYDALELKVDRWSVRALDVRRVESSYFSDPELFPKGSTAFDCALLMRDIGHEWHERAPLCCAPEALAHG